MYTLCINTVTGGTGIHDPSASLFDDGNLVFGAEEERFIREKHPTNTFPIHAVEACLDHAGIELPDVDKILLPWTPSVRRLLFNVRRDLRCEGIQRPLYFSVLSMAGHASFPDKIENRLSELGTPVPPIETRNHHRCHAASAFYPTEFDEAIIVTLDGRGDFDSTVVWQGDQNGLHRIRSYHYPNSWGAFYAAVTDFLGYYPFNGEGKVMGLAPYGDRNADIERALRSVIDVGVDYDVTGIVGDGGKAGTRNLERLFGRSQRTRGGEFSDWEKDLAHVIQVLLEDTIVDIVEKHCDATGIRNVALAGGVALNCKMNKRIMESYAVDEVFVQPVASDPGSAVGAGMLEAGPEETSPMSTVYWGPEFSTEEIAETLVQCKIDYTEVEDVPRVVAERLAEGELVGWFQGRLEMGPRALGNRSILADPRTIESRDRVNRFVKHREEWRPFAPSMLEEAVDEYLVDGEPAPYMIKTFDVKEEKKEDIRAVIHAADETTRPQTVRKDQNPRYYELIREFEKITGVPVVLNTSFNDHGEPIVNTPTEALKDFFGMGLDLLVLGDVLVEKQTLRIDSIDHVENPESRTSTMGSQ